MSKYLSYLITLYYHNNSGHLLRVAIKIDKDKISPEIFEYWADDTNRKIINALLPMHCQGYDIVEIEEIFEVVDSSMVPA